MKKTLLSYGFLGMAAIAVAGGTYLSLENSEGNKASIMEAENVGSNEELLQPAIIESDTLSAEEVSLSETLDISSLKTEANSDEILDITEHKSIETQEIFGVVRTDLSFRIKGSEAIGGLSFDSVYGQAFLNTDGSLNAEQAESYINEHIMFIGSGSGCDIESTYTPHDENTERLSMITDTYAFTITAKCQKPIESASIGNSLFYDERTSFAHLVSIYTRKRTSVQTLKSLLITPENPTLEWNTPNEIEPVDSDADGLLDGEEELYGTDKNMNDTDGDGDSDYKEIERGTNPLVPHTY